jgi:hypothetical protein
VVATVTVTLTAAAAAAMRPGLGPGAGVGPGSPGSTVTVTLGERARGSDDRCEYLAFGVLGAGFCNYMRPFSVSLIQSLIFAMPSLAML